MSGKTYYDVIGVPATATAEEIRQAYLLRMKVMHPDRFDQASQPKEWKLANTLLEELNAAYATLRDPILRGQYDLKVGRPYLAKGSAWTSANTATSTAKSYTNSPRASAPKTNWNSSATAQQTQPKPASPYQKRDDERSTKTSEPPPRFAASLFAALLLLGLVVLFGVAINASRLHLAAAPIAQAPVPPPAPAPVVLDYDEQAFPASGTIYGYSSGGDTADLANQTRPGIALFTVHTVSDDKFFVKLIDVATNQSVLGFCASPNATVTVKVPLGTYAVRYATGKKWYGIAHLFGPSTQYCWLNRKLNFLAHGPGTPMNAITLYSAAEDSHAVTPIVQSEF